MHKILFVKFACVFKENDSRISGVQLTVTVVLNEMTKTKRQLMVDTQTGGYILFSSADS